MERRRSFSLMGQGGPQRGAGVCWPLGSNRGSGVDQEAAAIWLLVEEAQQPPQGWPQDSSALLSSLAQSTFLTFCEYLLLQIGGPWPNAQLLTCFLWALQCVL